MSFLENDAIPFWIDIDNNTYHKSMLQKKRVMVFRSLTPQDTIDDVEAKCISAGITLNDLLGEIYLLPRGEENLDQIEKLKIVSIFRGGRGSERVLLDTWNKDIEDEIKGRVGGWNNVVNSTDNHRTLISVIEDIKYTIKKIDQIFHYISGIHRSGGRRRKRKSRRKKHRKKRKTRRKRKYKKGKTKRRRGGRRKTRIKKKMIGGGKTKEEIIAELKSKGRYDEWVALGSKFGLTSDTLIYEQSAFLERPFNYYNVDENIVPVSMVQKTYRDDVDNIAVFEQLYVKDPTHVDQSKFRIVDIKETLSTTGLVTCTGLAMIIGTKKFMTHLDAATDVKQIISAVGMLIAEEEIDPSSIEPIIYAGRLDSKKNSTLQKARDICLSVGIPAENFVETNVCMMDTVKI